MLVTLEKFGKVERPAVTSLDVAETFGKEHKNVLRDIENLGCSEEFNRLNFEQIFYIDVMHRKQKAYAMTRDGFTILVMGYTGKLAMKFKEAYIRQFNVMESMLIGKQIEREKGIAVRQALTKALQQSAENERMHGHAYSNYTNCIYKVLFNMNASQLREHFKIDKKDSLRDYFTVEELQQIQSMENLVSGLIDCGWSYEQVKAFIENTNVKKITA